MHDRRKYARHFCDLICEIKAFHGETWIGHVSDVSEGGVELLLARSYEPSTLLGLLARNERMMARVVRVSKGPVRWRLGCQLVSEIDAETLRDLLCKIQVVKSPVQTHDVLKKLQSQASSRAVNLEDLLRKRKLKDTDPTPDYSRPG